MKFNFLLFLFIFLFNSCTKLAYIVDQSSGQLKLLFKARKNEDILKDKTIKEEVKNKIKNIITYKNFFYNYFKEEHSSIYNKTTILDTKAVTYLLIASPFNRIEAKEFSFPIVGSFPYIGFFSENKAKEYAKNLEQEDYQVFIRPVYAYSTLGHFNDPILSSFFYYPDYDLAELIFHELFHTVIFIEDEVEVNENLANFFGKKLADEYYNITNESIEAEQKQREIESKFFSLLAKKLKNLNKELVKKNYTSKSEAQVFIQNFQEENIYPELKDYCALTNTNYCNIFKKDWNNAKMSSYLTYESSQDFFENYFNNVNLSLYDFYKLIKKEVKNYSKNKENAKNFIEYLKKRK